MGLVRTRPQLAEDGSPHRAGAEVLPVPMLPISNWVLKFGIDNTGNIITK